MPWFVIFIPKTSARARKNLPSKWVLVAERFHWLNKEYNFKFFMNNLKNKNKKIKKKRDLSTHYIRSRW